MNSALHPNGNKSITVLDYINEFGTKLDEHGDERIRPLARCPACSSEMHTKGETNPTVDGIFSHQPNSNHFCPLKVSEGEPYVILPPVDEDPNRTSALRASFMNNWKYHYSLMKGYLKVLNIFDFIKLIKFADQKRIWSYRHAEENQIPYIFLVLKEFPPVKSKGKYIRRDWIRFWFDSRIRSLEDLQIETNGDWFLVKATYANPRSGGTPNHTQLKTTEIQNADLNFLNKEEPEVADFLIKEMKKEFGVQLPNKLLKKDKIQLVFCSFLAYFNQLYLPLSKALAVLFSLYKSGIGFQ